MYDCRAKTWETDFRYRAIQASIRHIPAANRDDPFSFDGSFCLPVGAKPLIGWTPGRTMLIAIFGGFALLAGGLGLSKLNRGVANAGPLMMIEICCGVGGIATFFLPLVFYRQLVQRCIGERSHALMERSPHSRIMAAELSNNQSPMRISIDGCDQVLVLFDEEKRRLMVEGLGARYQIRADDVEEIVPFLWMNHVGVTLLYRIDDDTRLRVVIARASLLAELLRQLHAGEAIPRFVSNRLFENSLRTLAPGPVSVFDGVRWRGIFRRL